MLALAERGLDLHPVEDFDDIVDALACWPNAHIVVLRAFIDGSIRPDDGVMSVGGFAFGQLGAQKAEREWRAAMGGRKFHMTDLHNRHGEFADFTPAQSGELITKLVKLLKRRAQFSASVSCDIKHAEEHLPKIASNAFTRKLLSGVRKPYSFCLYFAMSAMAHLSRARNSERICYLIEAGDEYQGEALAFLTHAMTDPEAKRDLLIGSVGVVSSDDATLLATGDFMAWEWAMHIHRFRNNAVGMRRPLAELWFDVPMVEKELAYITPICRAYHMSEEVLAEYGPRFARLFVADSAESIRQALA